MFRNYFPYLRVSHDHKTGTRSMQTVRSVPLGGPVVSREYPRVNPSRVLGLVRMALTGLQ